MAGRPKRTALLHALERRTREWAEVYDEDQASIYDHLDYAESVISSGTSLTQLAADISDDAKFEVSRDMLKRVLSEGRKEEANKRLAEARHEGAHGLAENAMKIVDDASDMDKDKLTHAKMKAETRLWAAERWNRTDMGKAPDVSVVVNMNTLHLDSLRKRAISVELHKSVPSSDNARARSLSEGTPALRQLDQPVIDAVIHEDD